MRSAELLAPAHPALRLRTVAPWVANVAMAALYTTFAVSHVAIAHETGRWARILPLVVHESLLVALFLLRRPPVRTTRRLGDWLVAGLGTALPLLLLARDGTAFLAPVGGLLQGIGLGLALLAIATLGRSIGVVPADRGIKTQGVYGLVRHPAYAAYLLVYAGFTLTHPSAWNVAVAAASAWLLVARLLAEERCLGDNPGYRAYRERVPWRLLPGVF